MLALLFAGFGAALAYPEQVRSFMPSLWKWVNGRDSKGATIGGQPISDFEEVLESFWNAGWRSGPLPPDELVKKWAEVSVTLTLAKRRNSDDELNSAYLAAVTATWAHGASEVTHNSDRSMDALRRDQVQRWLRQLRQELGP